MKRIHVCCFCMLLFLPRLAGAATTSVNMDILITSPSQTISAISLTNGPPNLAHAIIAAGLSSGAPVSDVYADMIPISQAFSGTFGVSGANASSFSISTVNNCGSAANITCGKLVTNGSLAPATYNITVTTSLGGSQAVMVDVVSGTSVGCSFSALSSAAATGGATLLLAPSCTYSFTGTLTPANGVQFIGAGVGSTIFDGGNTVGIAMNGPGFPITGITLANLTLQRFAQSGGFNATINTSDNWMIRNTAIINNGSAVSSYLDVSGALYLHGGPVSIINNLISNNGAVNIAGNPDGNASLANPQKIIGNEISFGNNTPGTGFHMATCFGGGGVKLLTGNVAEVDFISNYSHDNYGDGFWFDTNYVGLNLKIQNNTIFRNGTFGIEVEDIHPTTIDISNNVAIDNGTGFYDNKFNTCGIETGATPIPSIGTNIWIHASADNVSVHDNNLLMTAYGNGGNGTYPGHQLEISNGGHSPPDMNNISVTSNTVTWKSQASNPNGSYQDAAMPSNVYGVSTDISGLSHTSTLSNNNAFHFLSPAAASDLDFAWWSNFGPLSFSSYQSADGQDAGSTIDTVDKTTTGCRHIACSSSGVGAGGVPIGQ
jgi:hypothetical protein